MIYIRHYSKDNFDEAIALKVSDAQKKFCPSIEMSLAVEYISPWDEKVDHYLIYDDENMIGAFYVSYTPLSKNNYWVGGFFIDHRFQNMGYGKKAMLNIIDFLKDKHPEMELLSLTVVPENDIAYRLYKSLGFISTGKYNDEGELILRKRVS